ncbi:hypothetical protein BAE44_0024120, partial [Dichanthelium oligosanthes]
FLIHLEITHHVLCVCFLSLGATRFARQWKRTTFPPDGILINGKRSPESIDFTVEQGKFDFQFTKTFDLGKYGSLLVFFFCHIGNTYRLCISNVGLQNTLNFLI